MAHSIRAVPIDEGFIDYTEFLSAIEAGGYCGTGAYEMCSPLRGGGGVENLDCYARKFLDFMRAFRKTRKFSAASLTCIIASSAVIGLTE